MAALAGLAPHTFILEFEDSGPPIYRLAGSAIRHVIGANPQGRDFYGYWDRCARTRLESYFDLSAESRRPFRLSSTRKGTEAVEIETVLIPVNSDDARKKRFIGVSVTLGKSSLQLGLRGNVQQLRRIGFVDDGLAQPESRPPRSMHTTSPPGTPGSGHPTRQ